MRAIWKGAVAFGLVNVPVKLYAATGEHEVPMHQVHRTDGGRIRYRRVCSIEDEPVEMSEIAKGYETDDGRLVVLTDEDLAQLPLTTEREIEVLEFVPADQVDPILLAKTYYLEPDRTAAKPYALLREALAATDRMAVVKVALRQRESMAVLRVREDVICLQTLLWPDEVRAADFPILDNDVQVRPQELAMASSLVEQLAGDFDPSGFEDRYVTALESVIEQKLNSGAVQERPAAEEEVGEGGRGGEVVDLLAALQRSVEKARSDRGEEAPERPTRSRSSAAKTAKSGATKAATSKTSATKATGTKSGTKAGGTKAAGSAKTTATAKKPAAKKPAARKPATKRAS
ncbi:Ku protein [Cellulomonas denverensis]|uniref:Non-homologous end joining protein Ku n=1 Tax=Cellulomonas denverensis TaxID=264297 RepID=A0A7X6KTG8_9CELL|nr:Ku protein [Cellulomonas denverensis]NKY21991.1 Ku protein [Cellulomonas denverensis]GIG24116.1 non-homologous end joining protein Ku [Cellulomonas denverensis]